MRAGKKARKMAESQADVSRREMLKLAGAAAVIAPEWTPSAQTRKTARGGRRFFTAGEFALVDELSELIIPTDEHSPGARAAKVAAYLDFRLSEAEAETQTSWRKGLQAVEALAREMHGRSFLKAPEPARIAVLTRMAERESEPQTAAEKFFVQLKERVAHAYYTSQIGLQQELQYKGNTYLREFVGTDVSQRSSG